ncbi:MAG: FtsH protease activity modulator HflK [Phycisphaerae bacterium]|nr:FtsH protease activity modulator HflK [Phycisphaerae bacterium]
MPGRVYQPEQFDLQDLPWGKILTWLPVLIGLYILAHLLWNGFYTVQPYERAVVLRFGKLHTVAEPGLHFMVPEVDEAIRVSIEEHSLRLPLQRPPEEQTAKLTRQSARQRQEEPLMLTGDLNAAVVEWTVQWRVDAPDKFLFSISADHIEETIHAVAQSVMHRLIGDYSIDEILTGKREEVGLEALKATQAMLDGYDCGIQITGLQMQRVTPPERVKPAFDTVNASIQLRDKLVNEANRERNQMIPQAQASRDGLIRDAEGYASRRKAEAQGEITALMAKYQAYLEAPEVTRQRLYLEAMEEVIRNAGPLYIVDQELRGMLPLLQLGGKTPLPAAAPAKKGGKP